MLVIFIAWLYILVISFVYGHALIFFLSQRFGDKQGLHFSLYVLSGFAILGAVTSYLSLFISISLTANALVLLAALPYGIWRKKELLATIQHYTSTLKATPRIIYVILFIAVAISLITSASPLAKFDDGLYYRQSIKWIETYPAIAGLGNLHLKFSFNSSWHLLSALFSFSYFGLRLLDLNGLLFVLMVLYALGGLYNILKKKGAFSDYFKVATFAPIHLLHPYIVSPSTDFVIPYLSWLVFILFVQKIERDTLDRFDLNSLLILLFTVFAVIIKLSAAPLALLSVYLLFIQLRKKNYKALVPVISLTVLLLAPWIARNIILSGYLIYPFYQLDVLSVDWKIPADLVKLEVLETKSFAKIRRMLFSDVDRLSIRQWLPYWFWQLQTSERIITLVILVLTAFLPIFTFIRLAKEKITEQISGVLVLFFTIYAGIFFWFFTAPHFRYGMGFTVGLYMISLSFLLYRLSLKYPQYKLPILAAFIFIFIGKPIYDVAKWYRGIEYVIIPGNISYNKPNLIYYKDLEIYVPSNNAQCWDAPLPCAPFVVDGIELRTGNIKDGFRITEPDAEVYSKKRLESLKEDGVGYNILEYKSVLE